MIRSVILFLGFFFGAGLFSQSDSLKEPLIDLIIIVSDQETGEPIANVKLIIVCSDGNYRSAYTNEAGKIEFVTADSSNFLTAGNTYTYVIDDTIKSGRIIAYWEPEGISTIDIVQNTRIIRDIKVDRLWEAQMHKLPSLSFNGYSREIDSTIQDSLDIIYNFMIENPTMIIQVVGLFEHEKDFSPFQRRASAVKKRLVEMGIPEARIKVIVEKYSE